MQKLRFDGRVVVVTGAGAGLGRSYALLFAERGASVVVNDLGGGRHGEGKSSKAADMVVQEIRDKGGKAVADYNSVEFGEKIIDTALQNFGRIDVVVNNAGILRDKSFVRIGDLDWDLIQRVHLKGAFKTTQAAWPHFRKQNYGRIIVTASNSGLYGNFGQANYSAAKMALVGLSNTLSIEGRKNNIHCNVIVPTAASRLTEDILPPDFFQELRPELIAPVVVWLCHESCEETGSIIESAAGWASKCHIVRGKGALLRSHMTDSVKLEDVYEKWDQVTDMTEATHMENIQEASATLLTVLEDLKSKNKHNVAELSSNFSYTDRDAILYALGVGATVLNEGDMRFLYESHQDFGVVPTYGIIPGQMAVMSSSLLQNVIPGKHVDFSKVLHGEQYLELLRPLPPNGTLRSHCKIADIMDKGSGAVILADVDTFNDNNEKVAYSQMSVFAVGVGNFGGKRNSPKAILTVDPPTRSPDATVTQKTNADQAALYRLSGDWNPLHIDAAIAAFGGFERPILHGLCSLGFSTRHVLHRYAGGDPSKFKAVKVRFAKPVLPGQTLQTDMWQQGNRIHFQTKVTETGNSVITGAYIDLVNVVHNVSFAKLSASELKSTPFFNAIKSRVESDQEKAKRINGIFLYNITQNGDVATSWTLDLKKGTVYEGEPKDSTADCILTMDDQDMVSLATGKLNPQVAFMKGLLKIKGNLMLVQKLGAIMKEQAKL